MKLTHRRILLSLTTVIVCGGPLSPWNPTLAHERPNIVFIMTDDQGPWALGASGDPNAVTPNLDRLRASGALLANCYTPTPVCSPARVSVLTSRYGTELGVTDFLSRDNPQAVGLTPEIITWPALLAKSGYATALIGKYHCGERPESHPTKIGYNEFRGFIHGGMTSQNPEMEIDRVSRRVEGYTPDILTDHAIEFIRDRQAQPFALSLHFWAPHANQHNNEAGDRTWLPLSDADWTPFESRNVQLPEPEFPDLDVPRTQRMLREYLGSVHSVDRNVGRLLLALDNLDLSENTIVIFTSDHGYNLGHHGIWHKGNGRWLLTNNQGYRANMWENSLRVPAIVRWPGHIKSGSTMTQTVSHLDWLPTIIDAAKTDLPADTIIRGRSIVPLLLGSVLPRQNDFFAQFQMRIDHGDGANMRSYQTDDWKLVRFLRSRREDEFYSRKHDPDEHINLIDSADSTVRQAVDLLQQKLLAKMEEIDDPALQESGR